MRKDGKPDGCSKIITNLSLPVLGLVLSFILLAGIVVADGPAAPGVTTVSLEFETQALDLDTGNIVESQPFGLMSIDGADVSIAFNADRIPHSVVMTVGPSTEIAVIKDVSFEVVTLADIGILDLSRQPPDVPFSPTDTVVIRTANGSVFKLGNAAETEEWATFDYDLLQ